MCVHVELVRVLTSSCGIQQPFHEQIFTYLFSGNEKSTTPTGNLSCIYLFQKLFESTWHVALRSVYINRNHNINRNLVHSIKTILPRNKEVSLTEQREHIFTDPLESGYNFRLPFPTPF